MCRVVRKAAAHFGKKSSAPCYGQGVELFVFLPAPIHQRPFLDSGDNAHDHYNSLSTEQITADLKESCDKIEAASGVRPTLIRCPYGEYDNHVICAVRDYGLEPIQWDVEALHSVGVIRRTACNQREAVWLTFLTLEYSSIVL